MGCCSKCGKSLGLLILILGIVFLLVDFGVWDFWGISWWTVVFVVAGLSMLGSSGCGDCQKACGMPAKKGKKK